MLLPSQSNLRSLGQVRDLPYCAARVSSCLLNVLVGCAGGVLARPQSLIAAKSTDSKLCRSNLSYNVSVTMPHRNLHSADDMMWCT